jgi:hypothetical protein
VASWASFGVEVGFGPGKLKRVEIFCLFKIFLWIAISFEFKTVLNLSDFYSHDKIKTLINRKKDYAAA